VMNPASRGIAFSLLKLLFQKFTRALLIGMV
jgi:hypothetical protein